MYFASGVSSRMRVSLRSRSAPPARRARLREFGSSFRRARPRSIAWLLVDQGAGAIEQRATALERERHAGEPILHQRLFGDRTPELHPLLGSRTSATDRAASAMPTPWAATPRRALFISASIALKPSPFCPRRKPSARRTRSRRSVSRGCRACLRDALPRGRSCHRKARCAART